MRYIMVLGLVPFVLIGGACGYVWVGLQSGFRGVADYFKRLAEEEEETP
jgi:hypothetical protein